jgi:hypothetical protein
MKFIISESKLKKIAYDALDNKIKELGRSEGGNFIYYSLRKNDNDEFDPVIIEYDFEDGRLFVDLEPFFFILSMFGLDNNEDELKQFFMDWFEHYEGIKPEYVLLHNI